jgi:DMSO/TMAO reductase YedYZ heme-binding membrane subunit
MSNALFFALFALLAFGFVFKAVSVEERRNFFRTAVAILMVLGLVSYFVHPLLHNKDLKQLLDLTAIVSFVLAVLFLLAYIKLDQKVRLEKGELHPLEDNKGKKKKGGR